MVSLSSPLRWDVGGDVGGAGAGVELLRRCGRRRRRAGGGAGVRRCGVGGAAGLGYRRDGMMVSTVPGGHDAR
ncbi:hypothetical protein FGB62_181g028 [Gracilaria domingensis]|nr:hypothetical protein FGB62_181g028 [Gracilaria domingensis]